MVRPFDDLFIPDGDEARRWAEQELANPQYDAAKPTWFDLVSRDVARFFEELFSSDGGGGAGPIALIIVSVIIVGALIAAVILWGKPRSARSVRKSGTSLLGERDDRTAAQLRADAERSARDGDWDAATILRFRALARGLLERDLIDPAPGATAQAIAREATSAFADEAVAMRRAAVAFDDVRYLRHPATAESYRVLAETDHRLATRRPAEALT